MKNTVGIKKIVFALILLTIASCTKSLKKEEYVKWVSDYKNGLHKKKAVNHVVFDLQYMPADYVSLAYKNPKNNTENNNVADDIEYFSLQLSIDDKSTDITRYNLKSKQAQQNRIYYMSFPMQEHFFLIEGNDTLPCLMYHFISSYDLSMVRTIELGFKKKKNNLIKEKIFVFDSDEFLTGPVKIALEKKDLINLSKIKLVL